MSAGTAGAPVTWLMHLHLQALIPLSLEGTEVGQTKAAQALAKITITSNPEMAFPGERVGVMAVGWGMDLPKGQLGYCRGAASRRGCDGASLLLLQTGVCLPGDTVPTGHMPSNTACAHSASLAHQPTTSTHSS